MNSLPVIVRELRVAARRPRTYYARSLAALIVLVMSVGMVYAGFGNALSAASAGKDFFLALSLLGFAYVLLNGAFSTADCLSQEKREGTIGLLFLTNLKGFEIVTGKLISRTANAAYCVVAALPALGLAIILGGVTGKDFLKMALVLANGLFFSACFGLLVSACCRSERRALSAALSSILFLSVVLPWIGEEVRRAIKATAIHPFFLITSPGGTFLDAAGLSMGVRPPGYFGWSLGVTHLIGWICLVLAGVILPRAWQDKISKAKFQIPIIRARRHKNRQRWLDLNPTLWLKQRPGQRGLGMAALFGTFALAWFGAFLINRSEWLILPVYACSAVLLHVLLMYAATVSACRGPAEERRSGTLELLLTTPLGADVILQGHLLALKRRLLGPLVFVLVADAALAGAGCWQFTFLAPELIGWLALFVVLIAHLFVDLYALSWVGTWLGFKAKTLRQAMGRTIGYVLLSRWLILFGSLALMGLATEGRIFNSPLGGVFVVFGYITFSLMCLLHFCGLAMSELKDELRELAANQDELDSRAITWWPFAGYAFAKRHLTASLSCLQKLRTGSRVQ